MSDEKYRKRIEELVFNKKLDESLDLTEGNKQNKKKLKAHLQDVGRKAVEAGKGLGTAHMKQGETNKSPSFLLRRGRAEAQKGMPTQEPMPARIARMKKRKDESSDIVGKRRIHEIAKVEILSRIIIEELEILYDSGKIDESALGTGARLIGRGIKRAVGAPFRAIGGFSHGLRGDVTPSKGSISHAVGRRLGSMTRGLARGVMGKEPESTKSLGQKVMYAIGDKMRAPFGKSQAQMKAKAEAEAKKKQQAASQSSSSNLSTLNTSNDMSSDFIDQRYERIDEVLPFLLAAAPWIIRGVQAARLGYNIYKGARALKAAKTGYDVVKAGTGIAARYAGGKAAGSAAGKAAGDYATGMASDIAKRAGGAIGSGFKKAISGVKRAKGVADYVGGDKEEKRKKETDNEAPEPTTSNQDDSYRD